MAVAPILISLGISAGGMLAQYFLTPRIKPKPTDIGKADDVRITAPAYGAFIPRVWGRARLGGTLFFTDGVTETIVNSPTTGGKGAPSAPATRTYYYTSSLGVLLCRNETVSFLKIWDDTLPLLGNGVVANASLEAEDATLAGGATEAADGTASGDEYVTGLGSGGTATFDISDIIAPTTPATGDPDQIAVSYTRVSFFYKCAADRNATITTDIGSQTETFPASDDWTAYTVNISGFADSLIFANASGSAPDLDRITVEKYWEIIDLGSRSPNYQVTGVINEAVAYPKNLLDPSEYYNQTPTKNVQGAYVMTTSIPNASIRFYTGTADQEPDSALIPWLDTRYGAGNGEFYASAHRLMTHIIFENYQLKQGRQPNITAEINCGRNDVNDILEDLFADADITDYDLTETDGLEQIGFLESTQTSRRNLAGYLERYHTFFLAEIDGEIRSILYTTDSSATIDANLLRAHNYGETMPNFSVETVRKDAKLLPREMRYQIMNVKEDFHNDVAIASVFASPLNTEIETVSFPIVDELVTARNKVEKALLIEHSEDMAFEFSGMPEMAKYAVGDVITIPIKGVDTKMRIERKTATLPIGKIKFQCVAVNDWNFTEIQDDTTLLATRPKKQEYNFPRNSIVIPVISEPLTASERGKLGVYLAVGFIGRGAGTAISLLRETADDAFEFKDIIDTPAKIGVCEDTLATHGDVNTEDTTNVLDIWFTDDISLESVTGGDISRYPTINLIRVGSEWLQFRTATAQTLEANSPYRSKWRISNLTRGRFGTASAVSTHGASEYAFIYDGAIRFYELDESDKTETIAFKAVTAGQSEGNGNRASITFEPVSAYSITNFTERRTLDGNNYTQEQLKDLVGTMAEDLNL